jgi:hypothetical protein
MTYETCCMWECETICYQMKYSRMLQYNIILKPDHMPEVLLDSDSEKSQNDSN